MSAFIGTADACKIICLELQVDSFFFGWLVFSEVHEIKGIFLNVKMNLQHSLHISPWCTNKTKQTKIGCGCGSFAS